MEKKSSTTETLYNKFVLVANELRELALDEKSYERNVPKMSGMTTEVINMAYTIIKEQNQKQEKMRKEVYRLLDENNRLKEALKKILNQDPRVDLEVFE